MPRTKVVVRNLPPDLSMAAFVAAVDEVGFAGRATWHDYVPGKAKAKLVTPSVAYVGLVDEAAVFDFNGAFAGRCFADDQGKEWRATVEYAPYQRVPRGKAKLRHEHQRREGTIEKDREYQAFLAALEAGPAAAPSAEQLLERREAARLAAERANGGKPVVKMSALMKYIAAKRAKERNASERRRERAAAAKAKEKASRGGSGKGAATAERGAKPGGKDAKGRGGGGGGKGASAKGKAVAAEPVPTPKVIARKQPVGGGGGGGGDAKVSANPVKVVAPPARPKSAAASMYAEQKQPKPQPKQQRQQKQASSQRPEQKQQQETSAPKILARPKSAAAASASPAKPQPLNASSSDGGRKGKGKGGEGGGKDGGPSAKAVPTPKGLPIPQVGGTHSSGKGGGKRGASKQMSS